MSKHEKVLFTILRGTSDANIRFDDVRSLLRFFGFEERIRGSTISFTKREWWKY